MQIRTKTEVWSKNKVWSILSSHPLYHVLRMKQEAQLSQRGRACLVLLSTDFDESHRSCCCIFMLLIKFTGRDQAEEV